VQRGCCFCKVQVMCLQRASDVHSYSGFSVCRKLWIPWHHNCRALFKFTIECRHSWHSQTFNALLEINRKINQTSKFEAVSNFHIADIRLAMTGQLALALRSKIPSTPSAFTLNLPFAIVKEVHCHRNIVYTARESLHVWLSLFKS